MDILGRTVAVLIDKQQRAGRHNILWDGKDDKGALVASGVYVYTLTAGDSKEMKKLLLVR
jgi:flagellar hook assembly protein FlgD